METTVQSGKSMLKNKKGLTLIELMAVIVIIGIIAIIAIPAVKNMIDDSKTNADKATERVFIDAAVRYSMEHTVKNNDEVSIDDLKNGGYLTTSPEWNDTADHRNAAKFEVKADGAVKVTLITQTTTTP